MDIPALKDARFQSTHPEPLPKDPKKSPGSIEVEMVSMGSLEMVTGQQEEIVQQLAENLNQIMRSINYNLQFIPDREAGVVIIKVLDGNGKLIRQIPPEAFLSLSSRIGESIGIFINSKL